MSGTEVRLLVPISERCATRCTVPSVSIPTKAGMQDGAVGVSTRRGLRRPQELRNQAHAQDQGAGGNESLQKTATADVQNVVAHAFSPAAALIAARMRW